MKTVDKQQETYKKGTYPSTFKGAWLANVSI